MAIRLARTAGRRRWEAKRVRFVLFLAMALLPAAGWPQFIPAARKPFGDSYAKEHTERTRSYDLQHVLLNLTLDERRKSVAGTATLTLRPLGDGLETVEVNSAELRVHAVTLAEGARAPFEQSGETLRIRLPRPPRLPRPAGPSDALTLTIEYDGTPRKGLFFVTPDKEHPRRPAQIWSQ